MAAVAFDVDAVRARFPALETGIAFFDGPGGTHVPRSVIDAIADYLQRSNANESSTTTPRPKSIGCSTR